jgi:CheY-like chemotaxis protein
LLELHDDIRAVFTDIQMPGSMDGLKLAHYVRGRWPPVKLIITSGHARPRVEDMPVGSGFVGKPYGSSLFCVGGMHNRWVSWFGGLANRVVRGDARH